MRVAFIAAMIALGLASSAAIAEEAAAPAAVVYSDTTPAYRFFPGDEVEITVFSAPELSRVVTVAPDGRVALPLIGGYQVENALTAAGLALAAGEAADRVLAALEGLTGVPGRLDVVGEARGGLALVDYAHKPEALVAVLDACRPFATGRLICVMGCGGDRDKGKRPIMGGIAAARSDVVIVTDDNPRTEHPAQIRREILSGVPPGASHVREIGDRGEAIRAAVAMMGAGDVVLVAGKGHETGHIIGATVVPFSDHEEIAKSLDERPR